MPALRVQIPQVVVWSASSGRIMRILQDKAHDESSYEDSGPGYFPAALIHIHKNGEVGRGGSVKIGSQGWIIKRTLRGSFSGVSTPNFARLVNIRWKALDEIYKFHNLLATLIFQIRKNSRFS